ncbi:hypothetical protein LTR62_007241 [Meristemomyces frigidus]|uniref:Xylanolytic transcriptional activator regulatory domain-containing protein n=1 Tax=Meristemomyces frigidus TaxID=1508187 RepID=A0AAN7YDS3_9PEZI|nr:hypothetical protein LTR62_007241 [Meristemomyces frigidus]
MRAVSSSESPCIHFAGYQATDQNDESQGLEQPPLPINGDTNGIENLEQQLDEPSATTTTLADANGEFTRPVSAPSQTYAAPESGVSKRFISDLHPAVQLLKRSSEDARGRLLPNDDIGIWIDKLEYDDLVKRRDNAAAEQNGTGRSKSGQGDAEAAVAKINGGCQRPQAAVLAPLVDVYFAKFHPFLPLMDEAEFLAQQAEGDVPEALIHALCLVAAKDTQASPHLKLQTSPSTLPPREFCSRLYGTITSALRAPCQYDKLALIRILALTSQHSEGSEGVEESSLLLTQAMHHAQTLGIHLGQHSSSPADLALKRLFWSLWILDRQNSVINGRPRFVSEVDIAIDRFAPGESGFPAFDAWLKVTEMADKIIAMYCPHYPLDVTGWEEPYPGLEEILDEVGGWELAPSLHMTIHLYYLTIAVLSHRSRGVKQVPRSTASNVRQRLCASEIVRLMESNHAGCGMHALPFIPYSVSLALSVSYQHLRQSQFQHQQFDAAADFRRCAKILQGLRRTWSSVDTMAALARKVQGKVDKAPSLASLRITRAVQRKAGEGTRSDEQLEKVPCMPAIDGQRMGLADYLSSPVVTSARAGRGQGVPAAAAQQSDQAVLDSSVGLFDGMDDVFGTYMDPNYPVNLDDLSFLDDMQPFDYNNAEYTHAAVW